MQDEDTMPSHDGSIDNAVRRGSFAFKPKHRSLGLRHALATERGLSANREKNTGRNRMKRPAPSLPKLPWND